MVNSPQFITDAKGQRVGVVLSIKSYEKLLSAGEDAADIRAYRQARPKVMAEIAKGDFTTLAEYKAKRRRKA